MLHCNREIKEIDKSLLEVRPGNCLDVLPQIESSSVDLIITSPPYAEQRADKYNSIKESEYVDWFIPLGKELLRVLKPTGSFLLNIKAHCGKGERSLYVYELVIALKKACGFKFIDEYVWYKSALPRKWSHRLRDCWEPIFHFSKDKNYINHHELMIISESTFGSKRGYATFNAITGNVGGYHDICKQEPGKTLLENILYFPTALLVKDQYAHPAKFPFELIRCLVKGFCPKGGIVLDPFAGSGMTALAALTWECRSINIELSPKFAKMIRQRIDEFNPMTMRKRAEVQEETIDLFQE